MNKTSKQLAEEVTQSGAKVRYFYERYAEMKGGFRVAPNYFGTFLPIISERLLCLSEIREYNFDVYPNGGRITAEITTKDGTEFIGVADCSLFDTFDKEIGKKIALGRAIKNQVKFFGYED